MIIYTIKEFAEAKGNGPAKLQVSGDGRDIELSVWSCDTLTAGTVFELDAQKVKTSEYKGKTQYSTNFKDLAFVQNVVDKGTSVCTDPIIPVEIKSVIGTTKDTKLQYEVAAELLRMYYLYKPKKTMVEYADEYLLLLNHISGCECTTGTIDCGDQFPEIDENEFLEV